MRTCAGLAVLVLMLAHVPALCAQQAASSFMTGVNPSNLTFTPVNPTNSLYTPGANTGAFNFVGFSPMSFFRNIGNAFSWPPKIGNSNSGTLVTGPNPFPTTLYPFSTQTPYPTSANLPTMQMQTSYSH